MSSHTYTALCVGGPLDGQWRTVENRVFVAATPPATGFSLADTDAIIEPFVQHQYRVDQVGVFDSRVWIAVCEGQFKGSAARKRAVLRAILQRDVAAQMGVL